MKISVLIPTTGDIATVREHAAMADQLGYDSINCSHIAARDSFTTLAGLAHLAPSVTLATAVAPIYHRSPASMAQTAATIDDLSGGRFRLGLGAGHRATMGGWHGQDIGNPVAEVREYVALVRALLAGGEPRPAFAGTRASRSTASKPGPISLSTWPACPPPCCASRERSPTGWCCGPVPPPTSRTW